MKEKTKRRHRIDGSRLVTIISVAMVLIVFGITLALGFGVHRAARLIRSDIGLVVVVDPAYGQPAVDSVARTLAAAPYTEKVTARSADEVLARWEEMMGPEEMLDINPFLPEYEVAVKPAWAKPDSIDAIEKELRRFRCVDHIQSHSDITAGIDHSVNSVMLLLSIIGLVLLAISAGLIANTVRLQLHAQRYIIHTQQYVGATPRYIVRPYVRRACLYGFTAAVIAGASLFALAAYAMVIDPVASALVTWTDLALTLAVLILLGVTLCGLTAFVTAKNYVDRSYDEIFN